MDLPANAPAAVTVAGVSKSFQIPHEQLLTLKERALHPFKRTSHERLEALRDVSLEVASGEFFGIVGRNGSGKSTLLKCLAGIYRADAGRIFIDGRLATFIELGVGFNPDLAARDNVITNGIMLGLSPREARRRFDHVIEFAELEEFVDLKLKNYSSGMSVRLAFSVMIQADADVLLIDEVLAVGDASFQQKCFDVFNRLRAEGKTIVFVTHDMASVTRFCHRALLLERGRVTASGDPGEVATRYIETNFAAGSADSEQVGARMGDGSAMIEDVWFENDQGERATTLIQGRRATCRARVRFQRDVEDPSFSLAMVNDHRQNHLACWTGHDEERTGRFAAEQEVTFSMSFDNWLGAGRYHLSAAVAHRGSGDRLMQSWEAAASIVVAGARATGALVDLPRELTLERATGPTAVVSSGVERSAS